MSTRKNRAAGDERRAEVYRAAAQIILRKGFDATSVNDIAAALGMTKAGLYHYISGKKELLFDIMNFGLDELDEEVAAPARAIPDAEARLRFMIASHARLVTRGRGAITILVDEITALTPAQNRKITRRKREYFDCLRGLLDELKAQGKLRDVDTTAAAFSLLGMINWLSRWFRQDGALTAERAADEITDIALHGIMRCDARPKRR
ncbi:MAG TPA: TetR/AcrR family transcriptional regulator [Pyrinomonadaceae bacterium]|nr:TetR/AcrR family transcriptional regulator [Pyrinomonadaceae bacterium]